VIDDVETSEKSDWKLTKIPTGNLRKDEGSFAMKKSMIKQRRQKNMGYAPEWEKGIDFLHRQLEICCK